MSKTASQKQMSQTLTRSDIGLLIQPKSCVFSNYEANHRYSFYFSVTNCEKHVIRVRVVPPANRQFILYENGKEFRTTGSIAPGLSVGYELVFFPTTLQPITDNILIQTEKGSLSFEVIAQLPTPIITLPQILDCGPCYSDSSTTITVPFRNLGGKGTFGFFRSDNGFFIFFLLMYFYLFSFFFRNERHQYC